MNRDEFMFTYMAGAAAACFVFAAVLVLIEANGPAALLLGGILCAAASGLHFRRWSRVTKEPQS